MLPSMDNCFDLLESSYAIDFETMDTAKVTCIDDDGSCCETFGFGTDTNILQP